MNGIMKKSDIETEMMEPEEESYRKNYSYIIDRAQLYFDRYYINYFICGLGYLFNVNSIFNDMVIMRWNFYKSNIKIFKIGKQNCILCDATVTSLIKI